MIEGLRGIVWEKSPEHLLLDVAGVIYGMQLSLSCYQSLPEAGEEAFVASYLVVREDSMQLFAFSSREERQLFERFIGVSKIGPKLALALVSSFSPVQLRTIIMSEDINQLSQVPGIGKKTAQRVILELKGMFEREVPPLFLTDSPLFAHEATGALVVHSAYTEAYEALLAMGFTDRETELALKGFQEQGISEVGEMINFALRKLGGR